MAHPATRRRLIETATMILRYPECFDATYALLTDDESRDVFDWYICHRITSSFLLGYGDYIYPSPITAPVFAKAREEQKSVAAETGFSANSLAMLALGQYCLPGRGACVREGDVVLDVGCSGDTAWMFRKQTGDGGRVYVFEPISAQIAAIQVKCRENSWDNVEVLPYGLWDEPSSAEIAVAGACSSLMTSRKGVPTETIALMPLDVVVRERQWDRVDFIKMDVEGAEQKALVGCRETIERFAPRLAISIYHLGDDMVRIPQLINGMHVDYRYYLRHYSDYSGETVFLRRPEIKVSYRRRRRGIPVL